MTKHGFIRLWCQTDDRPLSGPVTHVTIPCLPTNVSIAVQNSQGCFWNTMDSRLIQITPSSWRLPIVGCVSEIVFAKMFGEMHFIWVFHSYMPHSLSIGCVFTFRYLQDTYFSDSKQLRYAAVTGLNICFGCIKYVYLIFTCYRAIGREITGLIAIGAHFAAICPGMKSIPILFSNYQQKCILNRDNIKWRLSHCMLSFLNIYTSPIDIYQFIRSYTIWIDWPWYLAEWN